MLEPSNLDPINRKILAILQTEARISFAELGKRVHLSAPAVTERVRRLEEAGLIQAYTTQLDETALGFAVQAFALANILPGKEAAFLDRVREQGAVVECHNITGEKAYLLKLLCPSTAALDALLESLSELAKTETMVVLSTPVDRGPPL